MAYSYEVKPLSTNEGVPVVPGTHHVSPQIDRCYIAYGMDGTTMVTRAVIYEDDTGRFLVGAEPDFLDTLGVGETLDDVVYSDPGDWRTYHCGVDYTDNGEGRERSNGFGDIPTGILVALSRGAPLPLALMPAKFEGVLEIFGFQASAPWSCAGFNATEIEADTTWYGDT